MMKPIYIARLFTVVIFGFFLVLVFVIDNGLEKKITVEAINTSTLVINCFLYFNLISVFLVLYFSIKSYDGKSKARPFIFCFISVLFLVVLSYFLTALKTRNDLMLNAIVRGINISGSNVDAREKGAE